MRLVFCVLLAVSVTSMHLRASQEGATTPSSIQYLVQLFGETLYTLTEGLESDLLQQLYPSNFHEIQLQLDLCESAFLNHTEDQLGLINEDVLSFKIACSDDDPAAPMMKLMQDTLQLMANIAVPCADLKVDLIGDIEKMIAGSVVSGLKFGEDWTGPLIQWNVAAVLPTITALEPYMEPLANVSLTLAAALGVSPSTLNTLENSMQREAKDWTSILTSLANGSLPTNTDLTNALNDVLLIDKDAYNELKEVLTRSIETFGEAATVICELMAALEQA